MLLDVLRFVLVFMERIVRVCCSGFFSSLRMCCITRTGGFFPDLALSSSRSALRARGSIEKRIPAVKHADVIRMAWIPMAAKALVALSFFMVFTSALPILILLRHPL